MTQFISQADRLRGGMYGLLIGDAMGVPYEFKRPMDIPSLKNLEMIPEAGYRRSFPDVPPGTWSDDGAQALILLEVILDNPSEVFPSRPFIEKLNNWRKYGYMAVDNNVFDIGGQTLRALADHAAGMDPDIGQDDPRTNGNGALMRNLPVALTNDLDERTYEFSYRSPVFSSAQSHATHKHAVSKVCCCFYTELATQLMFGHALDPTLDHLILRFRAMASIVENPDVRDAITLVLDAEKHECTGSGYVVDSMWTAISCLRNSKNYRQVIVNSIRYGKDTDTTAAIAGGLAGVMYGVQSIPESWMRDLRGREMADPLIERLVAYHEPR